MAERRTAAKVIRFHPEELDRIRAHAQACGQTSARFIRETALGAIPKARHDAAADPLLRELARIGRCLDQAVRLEQAGQHTGLGARAAAALDRLWTVVGPIVASRRQPARGSTR
jgi:hypothetical protein